MPENEIIETATDVIETATEAVVKNTTLDTLWKTAQEFIASYGFKIIGAIVVLIIGLKLINSFSKLLGKTPFFSKADSTASKFINSAIRIILKIVLFLTVAAILGVPMTSMVALIGSAGLAVGLAIQGSLSNIAGGVLIMLLKPFKVGDFIGTSGYLGTVEEITVFCTSLLTIDNQRVVLPNGSLANSNISNYSAMPERRVDLDINVAYSSDIDKVRAVVTDVVNGCEKAIRKDEFQFVLAAHDASALKFFLRVWCKGSDYWDVYFYLTEAVKKAFDKNGIEIPFQQIDVHLDK